ncbi:nitric oxide reductase activation protein NorD [Falsiroseomonas sp. E2-1-a20]|uniref:nitric oxide reductase activation protein NorD n=1 Tax=Falsiroseomonas sp. E2-1-a20 TaxID=3239300 RepID=UPI003F369299
MSPLFEPEETIGHQWHRLIGSATTWPHHPEAAVHLDDVRGRLGVMFRALGGPGGVPLAAAGSVASRHRLGLRQRLGLGGSEKLEAPRFDGETVELPETLDLLPDRDENAALYEWLAVWFAAAGTPQPRPVDPLQADVARLRDVQMATSVLLLRWPGLRALHARLCAALLAQRPRRRLPRQEAALEVAVRYLLSEQGGPLPGALDDAVAIGNLRAPRGYRPFLPVPLWGETVSAPPRAGARQADQPEEEPVGAAAATDARRRRARRRENDQTRRRDPLLLTRFETIIGLAEMANLNRAVDDDDVDSARKAADDLDEIAVGPHERRAATRLKLELDLAPAAASTAALASSTHLYPEWDHSRGAYHPAHCRVIAEAAEFGEAEVWIPDEAARRRLRRVRRQFEALRPRRQILHAQPDGDEVDLGALVRAVADRRAGLPGSERVFSAARAVRRDLSVAVLVDVSLSTDSWVGDRRVLDVEKEALLALAGGLEACGDESAIFTFTSRRREQVWVRTVKDFDDALDDDAIRRIQALKPGHYTRMGAAVRHVARTLAGRPHDRRLLLLLTDGKPNDADHYEGRYAVEDTRMAIREARRARTSVFGITVDREARDYFPYIFGPGAYAIFPDASHLTTALPAIYRQLTA